MARASHIRSARIGRMHQQGVVLMIALIILVAMTLAGIGIIRSIDTGGLVAGNIGLRQAAVASADSGIEAARTWLIANISNLDNDIPASGYYASRNDRMDVTGNRTVGGNDGVNWGGSDPSQTTSAFTAGALDSSGNTIYYVINRLCTNTGSVNALNQSCATATQQGIGSTQGAPDYSSYGLLDKNQIYYRVTARVSGPKNTVSYVQAVILL